MLGKSSSAALERGGQRRAGVQLRLTEGARSNMQSSEAKATRQVGRPVSAAPATGSAQIHREDVRGAGDVASLTRG